MTDFDISQAIKPVIDAFDQLGVMYYA